jgi:hypothetical protein
MDDINYFVDFSNIFQYHDSGVYNIGNIPNFPKNGAWLVPKVSISITLAYCAEKLRV